MRKIKEVGSRLEITNDPVTHTNPRKLGVSGLAAGLGREQWEEAIILESDVFSMVEYRGQGRSERHEFVFLGAAVAAARSLVGKRTLIYAIHKSGRSTLVNPNDYVKYIKARGEG